MISHGASGCLVESIDEAAYWITHLGRDRHARMDILFAARRRVEELADPALIASGWNTLFEELR
jgi:hypothetical protein